MSDGSSLEGTSAKEAHLFAFYTKLSGSFQQADGWRKIKKKSVLYFDLSTSSLPRFLFPPLLHRNLFEMWEKKIT